MCDPVKRNFGYSRIGCYDNFSFLSQLIAIIDMLMQNPEQNNFKGIVSRDGYFLKGYIMKSLLFVSALMVIIFF